MPHEAPLREFVRGFPCGHCYICATQFCGSSVEAVARFVLLCHLGIGGIWRVPRLVPGGGGHNWCISVGVTGPCSAQRELFPFPNPTDPLMTTVCDLGSFADCANNEIEETGGKVTPVRAHYPTQKKPYSRRYVRERVGIFDVGSTLSRTYLNQRSSDFTSSVE